MSAHGEIRLKTMDHREPNTGLVVTGMQVAPSQQSRVISYYGDLKSEENKNQLPIPIDTRSGMRVMSVLDPSYPTDNPLIKNPV